MSDIIEAEAVKPTIIMVIDAMDALLDEVAAGGDLSRFEIHGINFEGREWDNKDFEGLTLVDCKFDNLDLMFANFKKTKLERCSFKDTYLVRSNFSKAELIACDFTDANLSRARLKGARARNCKFIEVDFRRANMKKVVMGDSDNPHLKNHFYKARFDNANLSFGCFDTACFVESSMFDTNLNQASFWSADLSTAKLDKSKGKGICFDHAKLIDASLESVKFDESMFEKANMKKANMKKGSFQKSCFLGAILSGVKGMDANFYQSNLAEAGMRDVNLENANLKYVNFRGAHLFKVNMLMAKLKKTNFRKTGELLRITATASELDKALVKASEIEYFMLES